VNYSAVSKQPTDVTKNSRNPNAIENKNISGNVDSFYCSQLVWRAWVRQGYDLAPIRSKPVFPADLINSNKTEIVYGICVGGF